MTEHINVKGASGTGPGKGSGHKDGGPWRPGCKQQNLANGGSCGSFLFSHLPGGAGISPDSPLSVQSSLSLRREVWHEKAHLVQRAYELVSATKKGKRRKDSRENSKWTENERIQWQSKENGHTYIGGVHTESQAWVLQPAARTVMPGATKFLVNVWNKAGYSRAGKVKGPFLSSFRPITSSRESL